MWLAKSSMKSTWKLMNEATRSTEKSGTPIDCVKSNSSNYVFTNKNEIADELNEFHINVVKNIFDDINKNKFSYIK